MTPLRSPGGLGWAPRLSEGPLWEIPGCREFSVASHIMPITPSALGDDPCGSFLGTWQFYLCGRNIHLWLKTGRQHALLPWIPESFPRGPWWSWSSRPCTDYFWKLMLTKLRGSPNLECSILNWLKQNKTKQNKTKQKTGTHDLFSNQLSFSHIICKMGTRTTLRVTPPSQARAHEGQ